MSDGREAEGLGIFREERKIKREGEGRIWPKNLWRWWEEPNQNQIFLFQSSLPVWFAWAHNPLTVVTVKRL